MNFFYNILIYNMKLCLMMNNLNFVFVRVFVYRLVYAIVFYARNVERFYVFFDLNCDVDCVFVFCCFRCYKICICDG